MEEAKENPQQQTETQPKDTAENKALPKDVLKIMTFNVASLRASWQHGLPFYVKNAQPDILCIQETKMHSKAKPPVEDFKLEGYHGYFNHAERKGYSGTAIYTKYKPISIEPSSGITDPNGRCITAEFTNFYLVNSYVVNAGAQLENLQYKINTFNPQIETHIENLRKKKMVIWTGDLNVAHEDIDIWTPEGHEKVAGFTKEERDWFHSFLGKGYVDIFRKLYPTKQQFTFFNYRGFARAKNHGWRIDYFVINRDSIKDGMIIDCTIDSTVDFSDHLPVNLLLNKDMIIDEKKDQKVKSAGITVLETKKTQQISNFFQISK
ncbi:exodeoxyribonuclease III [Histomonas meleagridis]|uniref:exodeoxyribonuclease III n=1 Tax=Histomonas meleagridis TaxID=135588 RepID=UPI00355A11E1|nr:exodeoxyribonuclease III [Histomonas meleagridis]KAH0806663.1 exodeoxyribonuclease III [Histomonas meleagridis]